MNRQLSSKDEEKRFTLKVLSTKRRKCVCVCLCGSSSVRESRHFLFVGLWHEERVKLRTERLSGEIYLCVCVCLCLCLRVYM